MSVLIRRKRLQDGTLGELEKVFDGETDQEKIERLEEETDTLKDLNLSIMMASTEVYEEQYQKNLDMMLAVTELYEILIKGEV